MLAVSGGDGSIPGSRREKKGELERPVQHLYPLESSCDAYHKENESTNLNPNAPTFRQRRDASVAADARILEAMELEQYET